MTNKEFGMQWFNNLPFMIRQMITAMSIAGSPFMELENKVEEYCKAKNIKRDAAKEHEILEAEDLRKARQEISKSISDVSDLFTTYLRNDDRLQQRFMNLLSIMNCGVKYIDYLYQKVSRGKNKAGDLGNIRENLTHSSYVVTAGGKSAEFTPTHYESYLQIYKTPEKAVKVYARLQELRQKKEDDETLSRSEKKELKKLERMDILADNFDTSHQYMLEKDKFDQQDIDYAFALNENEGNHAISNMFTINKTAGDTYVSLILEGVFIGMKDRMLADEAKGGLPDAPQEQTAKAVTAWMDSDMAGCAKKNPKQMEMIIRGIKRSIKPGDGYELTKDDIKMKLTYTIMNNWLDKIFNTQSNNQKEKNGAFTASMVVNQIVNSNKYAFGKQIDSILNTVLKEKDEDEDQEPADKHSKKSK